MIPELSTKNAKFTKIGMKDLNAENAGTQSFYESGNQENEKDRG